MEELIKFLIKLLRRDVSSVLADLIRIFKLIVLLVISFHAYGFWDSHFKTYKSLDEILEFFVSGSFLKPLVVLIAIWIVVDGLLSIFLNWFFSIIFFKKFIQRAKEFRKMIVQENLKREGVFKRFVYKTLAKYSKKYYLEMTQEKLQELVAEIGDVDIERFNSLSLLIAQIAILLIILGKLTVLSFICITTLIILIQGFKALLIFYQITCKEILNNPLPGK